MENLVGSPSQPRPMVAWKGGDHYTRRTAIGVVIAAPIPDARGKDLRPGGYGGGMGIIR